MSKLGSMKFQVVTELNQINFMGESKHLAKNQHPERKVEGIYGRNYFRQVLATSIRFAEFSRKEHRVKSLFDLQPKHHQAFIEHLKSKGVTIGYMVNVESHLLKLQTAMSKTSRRNKRDPVIFLEERLVDYREKESPEDRSYEGWEIELLEVNMSKNVAAAMRMSLHLGFRTITICNIRKEHIVCHPDGSMEIVIPHGKNILKGGRYLGRISEKHLPLLVPDTYVAELKKLIEGKEPKDKILPIKENSLRQGLRRACMKSGVQSAGFHGFRHTFARRRLIKIMGKRYEEGKTMIDYILKNREQGRRMDYGIPKDVENPNRKIFNWVQDCVNVVHSELGHGKNRWALVAVYMS